jgi:hypothetical protein
MKALMTALPGRVSRKNQTFLRHKFSPGAMHCASLNGKTKPARIAPPRKGTLRLTQRYLVLST